VGGIKVFGAGILSSTSEIPFSVLSPEVTRRPFVTAEVVETDYDPSRMQDHLFVIPSYAWLREEAQRLVTRLAA
jgi:phenylalanine-4-hydroxylase